MTITEFLLARIAEDEAECKPIAALDDDDRGGWGIAYAERVLAECVAKRAIVAGCEGILGVNGWEYDDAPELADNTLRALAAVYKDHPDYRREWAND